MRILSCYIHNFGTLHEYQLDFCEGVNVMLKENGYGKSTLAAFIRAMFYGFSGSNKRSIEENERKKYKPWQGGVFGGYLDFENEGKEYRLTRIFAEKDREDEFELRDRKTNLLSKDYSANIGEELFHIGKESFVRTIFIGQNDCETKADDDINVKIGNLTDHTNDLNNYDTALERLTEAMNYLNPGRATGLLSKRREEIAALERVVLKGQEIETHLEELEEKIDREETRYASLKKSAEEISKRKKRAVCAQKLQGERERWDELQEKTQRSENLLIKARESFPGECPRQEDLLQVMEKARAYERLWERGNMYELSEMEKREKRELDRVFDKKEIGFEEIEEKLSLVRRLRELMKKQDACKMTQEQMERLSLLSKQFSDREKDASKYLGMWNLSCSKKAALLPQKTALSALEAGLKAQNSKKGPIFYGGILVGAVLVLVAAGMLFTDKLSAGILLFVAGLGITCFCLILDYQRKKNNILISPEMEELAKTIEEDSAFVLETEQVVLEYLQGFGIEFSQETAALWLQKLSLQKEELESLLLKQQKEEEERKTGGAEEIKKDLLDFLSSYGIDSQEEKFSEDLYFLREQYHRYEELLEKQNNLERTRQEAKICRESIEEYLKAYGLKSREDYLGYLNEILRKEEDFREAKSEYEAALRKQKVFEEEHDVTALLQENLPEEESLQELEEQAFHITSSMEEIQNQILMDKALQRELLAKYEEWEESREKLKELQEIQDRETQKYKFISKAKEKLMMAKENMTNKYADPILASFEKYYELLSNQRKDLFYLDANTNITMDRMGKQREINTLSPGYRDMIGICLRFALIDAMYKENSPFVILDDPFVNLDDGKLSTLKAFLLEVSKKYQIIYFTCSNSRCWL